MAESSTEGVEGNNLTENDDNVSAVEPSASTATANDGQDRSLESMRDPTMNSGSLSASPVESLEAGFYKV